MPSAVVAGITYDKLLHTLRVIYVSGMMYDFKDVPEEIYAAMKTCFSKGSFLNKYVKSRYEFQKVDK